MMMEVATAQSATGPFLISAVHVIMTKHHGYYEARGGEVSEKESLRLSSTTNLKCILLRQKLLM